MGIQAGGLLGTYEVLSPLGAGGMGEVYRARDTKLDRQVALKVLPESLAQDRQRMARFEREARTLASLNHSNIATIYGLETSNGIIALVMELVEGETLQERIARSYKSHTSKSAGRNGFELEDSLQIARQIAEALEYAHDRGVVHRDLKPANVKITPEGSVKVLDFGLAKVLSNDDATSVDPANSPTLSVMATEMWIILGTAAYMAPEQAKGKQVDRRADIWAFGCVLYEMLTGRKPFQGETISDVLAAVIRAEPDWTLLAETTPPSMQSLIHRCLQKDPKQRLRDIGDARIAIEEILSGEAIGATVTNHVGATPNPARRSDLSRVLPWGITATCLLSAISVFFYFGSGKPPSPTTRTLIMAPEGVQFGFSGSDGGPLLSPDGTRLIFPVSDQAGNGSLWIRPLDSLTAQKLQGTEGAQFPFWAPDSRQLGFFRDGKLEKIDVTGGAPILICDASSGRGGAWNKDGVIVFAPEPAGGLSSVPANGGTPIALVPVPRQSAEGTASDRWPEFLPDQKHFLFLSGNGFSPGNKDLGIYVADLASKNAKFLFQADSQALYAAPGYLLFLRGNTLMAQRFDADNLKLKGDAFPVAENVPSPQSYRFGFFCASDTGELVYATGGSSIEVGQLEWVDRTGKELGKVGVPQAMNPRLSPDGKQLAYVVENQNNIYGDIWLMDLARSVKTRFTLTSAQNISPVWSPDGLRIAFGSMNTERVGILVKDASGAGEPQMLVETKLTSSPDDWSPDGRYILYAVVGGQQKETWSLWAQPLFGDRKPFPYIKDQFSSYWSAFSPDGRWVAYASDQSGQSELYLSAFPTPKGKWQVSQSGGQMPRFSRDGKELFYEAPGGKMMEVSVVEKGSAVEIGTPHQLFQMSAMANEFDVAPDGKRFLVVNTVQGASPPLELVTNWAADMKN
jgi:eukaryotic-like serine/threonine-protein kinase